MPNSWTLLGCVTFSLLALMAIRAGAQSVQPTSETYSWPGELVNLDPNRLTITVKSRVVGNQALAELDNEVTVLAKRIAGFDAVGLEAAKQALWKIPGEISEWTSAVEYAKNLMTDIRARSQTFDDGMSRFREGQRNPGQG